MEKNKFNFERVLKENLEKKIIKEEVFGDIESAKDYAKQVSKEEGVVQHVNELPNGNYKVEDWFDSDTTVYSFQNGMYLEEETSSTDFDISPEVESAVKIAGEDIIQALRKYKENPEDPWTKSDLRAEIVSVANSLGLPKFDTSFLREEEFVWELEEENFLEFVGELLQAEKESQSSYDPLGYNQENELEEEAVSEEDSEEELKQYPWESWDGWNTELFNDIGLMDVLADAAKLEYELRNARRGSYALGGDSIEDVATYIRDLIERLEGTLEDIWFILDT